MSSYQSFLARVGIELPIIQAPMAGVSTPQLAAAVSNAGGLGSLGLGASSIAQARELILATKALTGKPFNVNLFCHQRPKLSPDRDAAWLAYLTPEFVRFGATPPGALREIYDTFAGNEAMFDLLLEERPAVVSFQFGLPSRDWINRMREAGIVTLACATTPGEAAEIAQAGIDAIVAQGVEAGGHRGVFEPEKGDDLIGSLALVRLIARQSRLPVIASGGIMDGGGIAAAIDLGAAAVQMGTAFILCPESSASAAYRAELRSAAAGHTRITSAISGRPARGLVNRMYCLLDNDAAPELPDYPLAYDAAKALHAVASASGDYSYAAHWAGQGAPLARAVAAAELVKLLADEWRIRSPFPRS